MVFTAPAPAFRVTYFPADFTMPSFSLIAVADFAPSATTVAAPPTASPVCLTKRPIPELAIFSFNLSPSDCEEATPEPLPSVGPPPVCPPPFVFLKLASPPDSPLLENEELALPLFF